MNRDTADKIVQDIRHLRSIQTAKMKWNQRQPHSSTRIENFEEIGFWRDVLNYAERKIGTLPIHSAADSAVQG